MSNQKLIFSCFIQKLYIFMILHDFSCFIQDLEWCLIIFYFKNIHVLFKRFEWFLIVFIHDQWFWWIFQDFSRFFMFCSRSWMISYCILFTKYSYFNNDYDNFFKILHDFLKIFHDFKVFFYILFHFSPFYHDLVTIVL